MSNLKLSRSMKRTLSDISKMPPPVRIKQCTCAIADGYNQGFCPQHARSHTVEALVTRGLVKWERHPENEIELLLPLRRAATHFRLTDLGRRTVALMRLGRKTP